MLQNKLEMPLDLTPKTSKLYRYYLYCLHVFALLCLTLLTAQGVLMAIFFVAWMYSVWLYLFKKPFDEINQLILDADNNWRIKSGASEWCDAELCGESIVNRFFIWLNFNCADNNKTYRILLLPDSADAQLLRRLRVKLTAS